MVQKLIRIIMVQAGLKLLYVFLFLRSLFSERLFMLHVHVFFFFFLLRLLSSVVTIYTF